jgi:hypothetical protein
MLGRDLPTTGAVYSTRYLRRDSCAFECNFMVDVGTRVADPGCLSRILIFVLPGCRISDPGSRIPDPKTQTKETGEKNLLSYLFLPQISQNRKLFSF